MLRNKLHSMGKVLNLSAITIWANAMQHTTSPFVIPVTDSLLSDHPHLKHLSRELALKYAHNEWVTEAELQQMGAQLWQALELDARYQQHCATKGGAFVRLLFPVRMQRFSNCLGKPYIILKRAF